MSTRLAVALMLLLSLLGCSHLKGPFYVVEGREFAADELSQIEEGTPVEVVLRLLGQPLEREPTARGEQWSYYVGEKRVDELRFLGLVPVRREHWERKTQARLVVDAGQVIEIDYSSVVVPPE